jgi:hypothetical protein
MKAMDKRATKGREARRDARVGHGQEGWAQNITLAGEMWKVDGALKRRELDDQGS